jgi:hypothetical protein
MTKPFDDDTLLKIVTSKIEHTMGVVIRAGRMIETSIDASSPHLDYLQGLMDRIHEECFRFCCRVVMAGSFYTADAVHGCISQEIAPLVAALKAARDYLDDQRAARTQRARSNHVGAPVREKRLCRHQTFGPASPGRLDETSPEFLEAIEGMRKAGLLRDVRRN